MKSIVFDSPYQESVIAVEVGYEFERGKVQLVPDEVADKLVGRNPHFKFASEPAARSVSSSDKD